MAVPIINGNQSVLAYGLGQDFVFQLTATTDSPITRWDIASNDTIPAGVLFDSLRGTFSGAGTTVGVWNLTVRAQNSTGWSVPVLVTIGIFDVSAVEVYRDVKILLDNYEVLANPFDSEGEVKDEDKNDGVDLSLPEAVATARLGDDLVWKISFAKQTSAKITAPPQTVINPSVGGTIPGSTTEISLIKNNETFTAKIGGKETTFEVANAPLVMARFAMRGGVSDPPFLQTDSLAFKRTTEIVGIDFISTYYIYASLANNPALEIWLSDRETELTMANTVTCEFELQFTTPSRAAGPSTQIVTTKPFKMRILSDIVK